MLVELQRKKPRRIRRLRLLALGAGIVALLLLLDAARPFVAQRYRDAKQQRALKQAKSFLEKKDLNNALLALQVAARANPENPVASRVAAEALESSGSNYAVQLRQQILALNPDSLSDQLALAATALRFQDVPTATTALASIAAANRDRPEYLKLFAALAFAQKRGDLADAAIGRLLELEPDNAQMRFNRAVIRLRHASREVASDAHDELARVAQHGPAYQLDALRELARDAATRSDAATALAWAGQLVTLPEATLEDALLHLNLLRLTNDADAAAAETRLAGRAAQSAADAAVFATWLLVQNRTRDASDWIGRLPADTRAAPAVRAIEAECAAARADWPELATLLKAGAWGPVLSDAIDLALSARTLDERKRIELRHSVWRESVELARANPATLRALLRLALTWGWTDDAETVLLAIARGSPHESWAFNALISSAYRRKDTAALKTAYSLLREAHPSNRRATGDWAMVTLLTEPSPAETRAKSVARELYETEPANPFFATTHAFALYQQKRTLDALAVMERLSSAELHVPGRALYYGLLLATLGETQRADSYLELAAKASLLPEERKLLEQAGALVASHSS